MLHIYFGNMPSAIYNTEVYFKNTYDEEWLTDDFAKEIVQKIDCSEILGKYAIMSPVLGVIPPTALSGGVKTLLLIKNCPAEVFNASMCCDKCAEYILKLGEEKDITINLRHIMDFGNTPFEAHILNDDSAVHNMVEMLSVAARYV